MKKFLNKFSILIGGLVKTTLILLVLLLVLPFMYFAWRAGQPMSMPEYGGRTYYELLVERQQAYTDLGETYQKSHPNVEVKNGACFFTEILVELMEIPMSARYALSSVYPSMQQSIDPQDVRNGYILKSVTWRNILPSSWKVFEMFLWGTFEHAPDGPVPYCRIPAP